jgi:hypothetical protein
MRRIAVALAFAVFMPTAGAVTPAGAAKHSTCDRLKGSDLAPARTVKLVKRRNADDGTDLLGCVLPRGRVRKIASSEDYYTTTYTYDLLQVAGPFALVSSAYNSQYAFSQGTYVADVRNGRSYSVASQCFEITGSPCNGAPATAPVVVITKLGRAVAAIAGWPGGPTAPRSVTIATFDPAGVRRDLDVGSDADIPPASLALRGTIASWTHAGVARTADISSPS